MPSMLVRKWKDNLPGDVGTLMVSYPFFLPNFMLMHARKYRLLSLSCSRMGYVITRGGEYVAGRIESLAVKPGFGRLTAVWFIVGGGVRSVFGLLAGIVDLVTSPSLKTVVGILINVLSTLVILPALLVSLVQQFMYLQSPLEPLSNEEKYLARIVFGTSLQTDTIRIVSKRFGVFTFLPASFVLGNLIYLKTNHESTLVHELVHCWQYRNIGVRYAGNALLSQWIFGRNRSAGNAYDWKHMAAGSGNQWLLLNAEAAAALIEDTYVSVISGDADFFPHPELVKNAYQALQQKMFPSFCE